MYICTCIVGTLEVSLARFWQTRKLSLQVEVFVNVRQRFMKTLEVGEFFLDNQLCRSFWKSNWENQ